VPSPTRTGSALGYSAPPTLLVPSKLVAVRWGDIHAAQIRQQSRFKRSGVDQFAGERRRPGARRTATMFDAPKSPPWDPRISDLCRLRLRGRSEALIFRPYDIFSIDSFEPPHGEMTLSNLLKMFDKHVVH
jgi:hypothetical protein